MAKLTAADRKGMAASTFAGPNRSFPIPDKNHARAALSGATRALHAGHISEGEASHIRKVADRKLGHSQSQPAHGDPRRKTAMRTP